MPGNVAFAIHLLQSCLSSSASLYPLGRSSGSSRWRTWVIRDGRGQPESWGKSFPVRGFFVLRSQLEISRLLKVNNHLSPIIHHPSPPTQLRTPPSPLPLARPAHESLQLQLRFITASAETHQPTLKRRQNAQARATQAALGAHYGDAESHGLSAVALGGAGDEGLGLEAGGHATRPGVEFRLSFGSSELCTIVFLQRRHIWRGWERGLAIALCKSTQSTPSLRPFAH